MTSVSWRRGGAAVLAPLVVLGSLLIGASAPAGATSADARSGAHWLAGELTDGLMHNDAFGGYDDYGLSLDAFFALDAANANDPAQAAIINAIAANVESYITGDAFGDAGSTYAGATAKSLVAAQTAGRNATSFGGINLVDRVESVTDDATGAIADVSAYGNYANVLGQSFAVQGLQTARSAEAPAARDFLLDRQCGDGSFPLGLSGACTSDTDATAAVVIALLEARSQGLSGTASAIDRAVAWLAGQQAGNGSFGGGSSTSAANTNSTGLAARALGLAGKSAAASKAAGWIKPFQVTSTSGPLGADLGAVAYNAEALAAGKADGITEATRDQWRRSTPAAVYALAYAEPDPKTVTKTVTETVTKVTIKPVPRTSTVTRTVVAPAASSATPAPKTPQGKLGAYLAGQLTNGDHVETKSGGDTFVDYDLTADTVLALGLLGQQPDLVRRGAAFLLDAKSIDALAHGAPYEKNASYAGPLAKLVIVAKTSGKDERAAKLADELAGLLGDDGLFVDDGKFADATTDTARHALIVVALTMTGHDVDAAIDRLLAAQCAGGGFTALLDEGCAEGRPAASGWALQALNAAPADDRPGSSMLDEGVDGRDQRTVASSKAVAYLQGVVRLDGVVTVGDNTADPAEAAATAAGRMAMGLDTSATARHLVSVQRKNGGFGGRDADVETSAATAPGLASRTWLTMPSTGLAPAVSLPASATVDDAGPAAAPAPEDSGDLTVNPALAYSVAGAAGLLGLAALGLGGVVMAGRRGVSV